jgi:hypothetical protein
MKPGGNADLYVATTAPSNPNVNSFSTRWYSSQGYSVEDRITLWPADPNFAYNTTYYVQVIARTDVTFFLRALHTPDTPAPAYGSYMDISDASNAVLSTGLVHCVGPQKWRGYRYRAPAAGQWAVTATTVYNGVYLFAHTAPLDGSLSPNTWNGNPTITVRTTDAAYSGCGQHVYIAVIGTSGSSGTCYNLTLAPPTGSAVNCSGAAASATPLPTAPAVRLATLVPEADVTGTIRDTGVAPLAFSSSILNVNGFHYVRFNMTQPGSFSIRLDPYPSVGSNFNLMCGTVAPTSSTSSSYSYRWYTSVNYMGGARITVWSQDPSYVDPSVTLQPSSYWCRIYLQYSADPPGASSPYTFRVSYLGETLAPDYGNLADLTPGEGVMHNVHPHKFRQYRYVAPVGGDLSFSLNTLYNNVYLYVSTIQFPGSATSNVMWSTNGISTLWIRTTDGNYKGPGGVYYLGLWCTSNGAGAVYNLTVNPPTAGSQYANASASPLPSVSPAASVTPYADAVIQNQLMPLYYLPQQFSASLGAGRCHWFSFNNSLPYAFNVLLTMDAGSTADLFLARTLPASFSSTSCSLSSFTSSSNSFWQPESITVLPTDTTNWIGNGTYWVMVRAGSLPANNYALLVQHLVPSPTSTPTSSPTTTPISATSTRSSSATSSVSSSATGSITLSSSETATASLSATSSQTGSVSSTATSTPSGSRSNSATATGSPSSTPTFSPTASETPSHSASMSRGASASSTPTASTSGAPPPSASSSRSATASMSSGASQSSTATASSSPSRSSDATRTSTATASASVTGSVAASSAGGDGGGGASSSATPSTSGAAAAVSVRPQSAAAWERARGVAGNDLHAHTGR